LAVFAVYGGIISIALTAYVDDSNRASCFDAGRDDAMAKPITAEAMERELHKFVH
jgi:CheY-like chemotaxis protein